MMGFELRIIENLKKRRDILIKKIDSGELTGMQSVIYSYENDIDAFNRVIEIIEEDLQNDGEC